MTRYVFNCRAGAALLTDQLVPHMQDGTIMYSHRIRPGINRDSHGLKVAKLADMPPRALEVASTTLDWLQQRESVTKPTSYTELHRALGRDVK